MTASLKNLTIDALPPLLAAVLLHLRKNAARPLLVGGCVRDALANLPPKDFDIEIYHCTPEKLTELLAPFGTTDPVGRSFGVIKLRTDVAEYDFSLPRRETKISEGHRGFSIGVDPELTPREALARRDFTINAIGFDPFTAELIDPYGGETDWAARRLRHTSAAFSEDPLRVLRAFQLAARFNLALASETAALCRTIANTFHEIPVERIWGEWEKWAERSTRPSAGLAVLEATGWLQHFPEISALRGTPQDPHWHPEGDVFAHTGHCLDALAADPEWKKLPHSARAQITFTVLCHDFGKPHCTRQEEKNGELRWTSPGHDALGGPIAENFLARIGAPHAFAKTVRPLVENHHVLYSAGSNGLTDRAIRRLAQRLAPASIEQLLLVLRADSRGRPPIDPAPALARQNQLAAAAKTLAIADAAPRPILLGRHLIAHGLTPGPNFKATLDDAFEAQLDGTFSDEASALTWLKTRLGK